MDRLSHLPEEVLYEIFQHLALTTPNPIHRKTQKYPRGYLPGLNCRLYKHSLVDGNTHYLHPLIAIKHVCRRLNDMVEGYASHVSITRELCERTTFPAVHTSIHNQIISPPYYEAVNKRAASTRLIACMWELCVYCGWHSKRRSKFQHSLGICSGCEFKQMSMAEVEKKAPRTFAALKKFEISLTSVTDYSCGGSGHTAAQHQSNQCPLDTFYAQYQIEASEQRLEAAEVQEKEWLRKHANCDESATKRAWFNTLRAGMEANGLEPVIKMFDQWGSDGPFKAYDFDDETKDLMTRNGYIRTDTCAEIVRYSLLISRIETSTDFVKSAYPVIKKLGQVARDCSEASKSSLSRSSSRRNIEFVKAFQLDDKKIRVMYLDLLDFALFYLFCHEFNYTITNPSPESYLRQYIRIYQIWGTKVLMPWSLEVYPQVFKQPPSPPSGELDNLPPSARKQYYTRYPIETYISEYRQRVADYVGDPKLGASCLLVPLKYANATKMRDWLEMGLYGPTDEQGLLKREGVMGARGKLEVWLNRSIMNSSKNEARGRAWVTL